MKAVNRKALPQATTDLNLARRNLDQFGYCLLENALDADRVEALRQRLVEQADAEQELGRATFDAGPSGRGVNQRIWFLTNKGQVFRDLPVHPWARELVGHLLGDQYLLSSMTANIVKAGGTIGWHVDQWWFPGPVERNSDYLRPGSFTKQQFRDRDFHEEDIPGSPLIAPAVACNVAWMISDYSEENGATLVVPGSHLWGRLPHANENPGVEVVSLTGPAGTAAVFDARIWHSTGVSVAPSDRLGILNYFCAAQLRQQENFFVGLDPEVLENASEELLALLGFRIFHGYGRIESRGADTIGLDERALGELKKI